MGTALLPNYAHADRVQHETIHEQLANDTQKIITMPFAGRSSQQECANADVVQILHRVYHASVSHSA